MSIPVLGVLVALAASTGGLCACCCSYLPACHTRTAATWCDGLFCPLRAAPLKAPVRAASPSMMLEETQMTATTLSEVSTALAANAGDFGGMTIPIIGLGLLAAIISLLAGPVED